MDFNNGYEVYRLDPTNQPSNNTVGGIGGWDSGSLIRFIIPNANADLVGVLVSGKYAFLNNENKVIAMFPQYEAADNAFEFAPYGSLVDLAAGTGAFGLFSHVQVTRAFTNNVLDDISQAPQVATFISQRHNADWIGKSTGNMAAPAFQDQSLSMSHATGLYGAYRTFATNPISGLLNSSPIPLQADGGVNGLQVDLTVSRLQDSGNTTWDNKSAVVWKLEDGKPTKVQMTTIDPVSMTQLPNTLSTIQFRIVSPAMWVVLRPRGESAPSLTSFVFTRVAIQRTPMNYNDNQFFTSPINNSYVKSIFYQVMDQNLQSRPEFFRYSPCSFSYNDLKLYFNGKPQVYVIPSYAQPAESQISRFVPNAFVMAAFFNTVRPNDWVRTALGNLAAFYYDPDGNGQYFQNIQVQFQMLLKTLGRPKYPFNDWDSEFSNVLKPFGMISSEHRVLRSYNQLLADTSRYSFVCPTNVFTKTVPSSMKYVDPANKYMEPIAPDKTKNLLTISEQIATLVINEASEVLVEEAPSVPGIPSFLHTNRAAGTTNVERVTPYRIQMEQIDGTQPYIRTYRALLPPSGKPGKMLFNFLPTPKYQYGHDGCGTRSVYLAGTADTSASTFTVPAGSHHPIPSLQAYPFSGQVGEYATCILVHVDWVNYEAITQLPKLADLYNGYAFGLNAADPRYSLVNTLGYPTIPGVSAWFDSVSLGLPQGQVLEEPQIPLTNFLTHYASPSQSDQWHGRWTAHRSNGWTTDSVYQQRYSDVLLNRQRNTMFSEWDSVYPCYHPTRQDLSDFYTDVPPLTCLDMTQVAPFFTQFKRAMFVSSGATKQTLDFRLLSLNDGFANCPAGAGYGHTCEPDFARTLSTLSKWVSGAEEFPMVGMPRRCTLEWDFAGGENAPYLICDCIYMDGATQMKLLEDFMARGITIRTTNFNFNTRVYSAAQEFKVGEGTYDFSPKFDEIMANPPYAVGGRNPKLMLLLHQYTQLVEGTWCLSAYPRKFEHPTRAKFTDSNTEYVHFSETTRNPPYTAMRDGKYASFPGACMDGKVTSILKLNGYELLPLYNVTADGQQIYKYRIGSNESNQVHEALLYHACQRPQFEKYYGMHRRNNLYEDIPWANLDAYRVNCYFCTKFDAFPLYPASPDDAKVSSTNRGKKLNNWYRKTWANSCTLPTRFIVPFEIPQNFRAMNLFAIEPSSLDVGDNQVEVPYANWFDGSFHMKGGAGTIDKFNNPETKHKIKQAITPMVFARILAELQYTVTQFSGTESSVTVDYPSGLSL